MSRPWTLNNGKVLKHEHFAAQPLHFNKQVVVDTEVDMSHHFDASGLYIVPGILDIHGDGFERSISPRPGVLFDIETALTETDKQLACNGITTAYLAMTISWEPGLRSLPMAIKIVDAVKRMQSSFITDIRLQLRWEIVAIDAVPHIEQWLHCLPCPTLAINDHFTKLTSSNKAHKIPEYASRAGLDEEEYRKQLAQAIDRPEQIANARNTLIAAANKAGVNVFSHDEPDIQTRQTHRSLGMTVCEFPLTVETAQDARTNDEAVILGGPNVVRGGSHIGAMDATSAIEDDLCNVLASDYYYPSLLHAVGILADGDENRLAKYWPLIAGNAADATNLHDRGKLIEGMRADALALSINSGVPKIESVFIAGEPVFIADSSRLI